MINTREIAEEYRLSHWAQIMKERQESGLSIKAYCRQIGICGNTYFYWQRRLRAAAVESGVEVGAFTALVPAGWTVCEPENGTQPASTSITISIGSYKIEATESTDMELLKRVVKALSEIC